MNCGMVLADKWLAYQNQIKQQRQNVNPIYMNGKAIPETAENIALNQLGLKRYCCRKHMLTHVDLMDKI
jgi:DNA-directed RNA polymerase I, II, and III subunit RPABC5